ncbi:hypothetical protein OIHEL45_16496 [Sulfitobacter indolifex HEL-45]|uniref:Uncharacterized protein n=1 Tax=Sulfitobacter indolifex HEL-45 TaxID=391624 RepID=A0ABP2D5P6_9RHOB|nr:hypothetical protein OIHEL45_16496 [Sulfitobacter indolifex HEL-45]
MEPNQYEEKHDFIRQANEFLLELRQRPLV